MPTTINNTLPNDWDNSTTYHLGDLVSYAGIIYKCLQTCTNKNPAAYSDYWSPLAIYIKDSTVMPHGDYSGDESFWERDQIYIDNNGWVYINNENTGINVQGKSAVSVSFDELTPAQRESIRGPRGFTGPQGATGAQGPQGPMGEVVLTPEQIEALTGPQGKSAYQSWLDTGHTGSEADFVAWLRSGIIKLDTAMSTTSTNGVQNKVITNAFENYKIGVNEILQQFANRIADLENRLKAEYNSEEHNFIFGITSEGKYGYKLSDTSAVIPFDNSSDDDVMITTSAEINNGIAAFEFASNNIYAAPTVAVKPPVTAASLDNDASNSTGEDDSILYGSNVLIQDFEDGFNAIYYIFKNNKFVNFSLAYNLYHMSETLISANTENIEGIWFNPNTIGLEANEICFEVEPVVAGTTISYEVGNFTDDRASLPSLVNGTYRQSYDRGTFNSSTVITRTVTKEQGAYLATTSGGSYKITRIYLR